MYKKGVIKIVKDRNKRNRKSRWHKKEIDK